VHRVRTLTALARQGLQHSLRAAGIDPGTLRGANFFEAAFGCGSSLFASAELGARSVGVDMDPEALARVRAYADQHGHDVEVHLGRVESFMGRDGEFNFVRASHVIEHTVEPRAFVSRLRELLRVGGVLMLECPNNRALVWLLKNAVRLRMNRADFYNGLKKTEHLWGFNRRSLAMLLEQEGFEVRRVTDYTVADYRYQPDVALWYPRWQTAIPNFVRTRTREPLVYATMRTLDQLSRLFAGGGMGLAAVAVRR
jgi:2-polyprenyl-3-methyl-5-hydroxy-6-metoxy-1,4-benzoquinol methylase